MNTLLILLLVVNFFAPYIGSWLPPLAGFPAGGIIRDAIIITIVSTNFIAIIRMSKVSYLQSIYLISWFLLSVWMVIVMIVADGHINAAILGARNIILFPLIGFLAFINVQNGLLKYKSLNKCIFVLGSIAAIMGILDVVTKGEILTILGYKEDYAGGDLFALVVEYLGIRRASGGFSDALNYGYTMSLFTIFVLYNLFKNNPISQLNKLKYCIIVVLSSIAVFLSLTRGAIIVLILGYLGFFICYGSVKQRILIIASVIVGLAIFSATDYYDLLYGRFTDQEKYSAESSQTRISMAEKAIEVLIENPLGYGLGTQGAGTKFLSEDTRINTDNYFLGVAVESGIMGLILLIVVLATNFYICYCHMKTDKTTFLFFIFLVTSFVVSALLSSAPVSPLYSIMFWVIINSEAAVGNKAHREHYQFDVALTTSSHYIL
jgi:hypothetical protein